MTDPSPDPDAYDPYVEALPRFNILTLGRVWRKGARNIVWYDETGAVIGRGGMSLDTESLALNYAFRDGVHVDATSATECFGIERLAHGGRPKRMAIVCPHCRRLRETLLFHVYRWKCRKCHGVHYLSSQIDRETRLYTRYVELGKTVSQGRTRYMRHETFAQLSQEYQQLDALLKHSVPRTLRAEHRLRVEERYCTATSGRPIR